MASPMPEDYVWVFLYLKGKNTLWIMQIYIFKNLTFNIFKKNMLKFRMSVSIKTQKVIDTLEF